jgi:predicted GNAT family N-acyltransferase
MAVAERFQRQGHGRRIVEEVEAALVVRGFTHFAVHARKPVVPFYEKLGYRVVGQPFVEVTIPHLRMEKLSAGT